MVLKISIVLLLSGIFGPTSNLLDSNQRIVRKMIKKELRSSEFTLKPKKTESGELYQVLVEHNSKLLYVYLQESSSCHPGGCLPVKEQPAGGETFVAALLFNETKELLRVKVCEYSSDYGYEIMRGSYLKKFQNSSICNYKNESDQVDAISGATVSSNALEELIGACCNLRL